MNCLYCGKKLPMVKKLTSEEFCSVAHRHAYQSEQETLGVARLVAEQQRLRPVRRSPLNEPKDPQTAPHVAAYLPENIAPRSIKTQAWTGSQSPVFVLETLEPLPISTISIPRSGLAAPAPALDFILPQGNPSVEEAMCALSKAQQFYPANDTGPKLDAAEYSLAPAEASIGLSVLLAITIRTQASVDLDVSPSPLPGQFTTQLPNSDLKPHRSLPEEALDFSVVSSTQLPFELSASFASVAPKPPAALAPSGAKRFSFSRFPGFIQHSFTPSLAPVADPVPLVDFIESRQSIGLLEPSRSLLPDFEALALLPLCGRPAARSSTLLAAGPTEIQSELGAIPPLMALMSQILPEPFVEMAVQIALQTSDKPQDRQIACFAGPIQQLFTPPRACAPHSPKLSPVGEFSAPPARTCVPTQSSAAQSILSRPMGKCVPFTDQFAHPDSFLRMVTGEADMAARLAFHSEPITAKARIAGVRRSSLVVLAKTFRSSRLVPIHIPAKPCIAALRMRESETSNKLPLLRPKLKLQIIPARLSIALFTGLSSFSGVSYKLSLQSVRQRWASAPNDLRWIALAIPLIIGLIWFAHSPSVQNEAKGRIASLVPNVDGLLNTSFKADSMDGIKQNIQRRAAVELSDDFRQGLSDWSGVGDWSRGWTYDPAGFIRPRQLALYTPSLSLEDYRFEFLGAIERKSLSWVFRAADVKNYYAARLEITRGGPLPIVELVRYTVIDGKAGVKKSIPLPMQGRLDTIYRVRVDVLGSDFVTTVQGQVVDVFSDDRLPRGGVGFFSATGEDARLRWIEVSHQYDMLGRLCAYLVPYNVPNSNVRSAP